jgi:hypothetical protein
MEFDIKKIIRDLPLEEYAEEYKGSTLKIWVNPDRGFIGRRDELQTEFDSRLRETKTNNALAEPFMTWVAEIYTPSVMDWYARLWSQGERETHWTVEELQALDERDPALFDWLKRRSVQMIVEHRTREKKA